VSYPFHPIANAFPLMVGEQFDSLIEDIRCNNLQEPIVLHEGKILDGRNRFRACAKAGVKPRFRQYRGSDPLKFVLSANLHRRHLNDSQRALVAARLANLPPHRPKRTAQNSAVSQPQAASNLRVSRGSVQLAVKVLATKNRNLIGAVDAGKVPVSIAAKVAICGKRAQDKLVAKVDAGTRPYEALRQVKIALLAHQRLIAPSGTFRVLLADPPWTYRNSQNPARNNYASGHYRTMPTDAICALPVGSCADRNAVLFLWSTSPMLADAMKVIDAWGFTYKASYIWCKDRSVVGHYNLVRHELLLLATRGKGTPDTNRLFDSVIDEQRGKHSAKPESVYKIIETMYPSGRRLEIFHRGKVRTGWECYGMETAQKRKAGAGRRYLGRRRLTRHRVSKSDRRSASPKVGHQKKA
jgi:N6-adenosine-specific RNA methylase IME4/ParB-like chromosome segregation protein Spo0J